MKVEKISDAGTTLALIVRSGDWEAGLNFISAGEDLQQVGLWHYAAGTKLTPHIHLQNPRSVPHTQEIVFVKQGRLRANVYSEARKPVKSVELKAGDFMVMLKGGHGYDILEDNTQVIEVKNGPFTSVEKDRERF